MNDLPHLKLIRTFVSSNQLELLTSQLSVYVIEMYAFPIRGSSPLGAAILVLRILNINFEF